MAQYTVTVNKLNRRKFIPSSFSDKSSIMAPPLNKGDTFSGQPVTIVPNPQLGTWIAGDDGSFYWGGGVNGGNATLDSPGAALVPNNYYTLNPKLINWNLAVPQIPVSLNWTQTQGQGVTIAIIDTGVYSQHQDLTGAITDYEDFSKDGNLTDYSGHGTHVCGLIGARSGFTNGVIGVAPKASIIVLKVISEANESSADSDQHIIDALNRAVKMGADIINMSMSISQPSSDIDNAIAAIAKQNIIIVASAGDNADLQRSALFYPAIRPDVISVASINNGYFDRHPDFNPLLNIVGPFTNYLSTYTAPAYYQSLWGCSMTTAFITGILALVIASKRNEAAGARFAKTELLQALQNISLPLNGLNYTDTNNFYFHINNIT